MSHAAEFGRESGNEQIAEQIVFDYREAPLDSSDRLLCDYAVKLTLQPGDVTEADLASLRNAGFDDDALSIAVQVISYFNYINRIADGLGVDPEEWMSLKIDDWKARKGSGFKALFKPGAVSQNAQGIN